MCAFCRLTTGQVEFLEFIFSLEGPGPLLGSKEKLQSMLGTICRSLAFPKPSIGL